MDKFIKHRKQLFIIFFLGIIVYFPIFFNHFVWDDIFFILENTQIHKFDIPSLLRNNLFNDGPFYRPVPAIYFSFLYSLFQQNAFFYHAIQLMLHFIGTFFLFIFFRTFFTKNIAFFLSLIFLLHPINAESVAYIGSSQSELFFIPGILALLLMQKMHLSNLRIFVLAFLLFVCIMTKEVGFLYFILVIGYRYIFKLNAIRSLLLASAAVIGLYAIFRLFIGEVIYQILERIPIAGMTFFERLLNIPAIIFYYIKTFLFPLQLGVWQIWVVKSLTLVNFIVPLTISCLLFIVLFGAGYFLYRNYHKQNLINNNNNNNLSVFRQTQLRQYIFFFLWFVIGLGMLLQIVPLDMTVADRWFYFPIVGALGMIGIGLQEITDSKKIKPSLLVLTAAIILSLLSLRTFIRTFDYYDNFTLYTRDLVYQPDNDFIMVDLANNYYKTGNLDKAIELKKKAALIYNTPGRFNDLGIYFQKKKDYRTAIEYFNKAIELYNFKEYVAYQRFEPYANLANTYLLDNQPMKAIEFLSTQALKEFPDVSDLYLLYANAYLNTGNREEALEAATKAFELSRNAATASLYFRLKNSIPANIEN